MSHDRSATHWLQNRQEHHGSLPDVRQVFMMEGTPDPPKSLLTQQYRDLSYEKHPDHGGSNDLMAELNEAYEQAKTELGY